MKRHIRIIKIILPTVVFFIIQQKNGCKDKGVKLSPDVYFGVSNKKDIIKLIITR